MRALAASAAALAAGGAIAQSDGGTPSRYEIESPVVPVHHEPHHRQVFQYGPVRILDMQIPPGDLSWFHTHEWPVLYMTLGRAPIRNQVPGGEWTGGERRGNDAPTPEPAAPRATSFTGYFDRPSTHRIENVGDGLFRAMVVVNESAGDDATSVEQAGFDSEPELTNAWFRSYRVELAPGAATPPHTHGSPVVILQATQGTGMAEGAMNFEFNEPGQWAFYDSGAEHVIRNVGASAIELLEIEVRFR